MALLSLARQPLSPIRASSFFRKTVCIQAHTLPRSVRLNRLSRSRLHPFSQPIPPLASLPCRPSEIPDGAAANQACAAQGQAFWAMTGAAMIMILQAFCQMLLRIWAGTSRPFTWFRVYTFGIVADFFARRPGFPATGYTDTVGLTCQQIVLATQRG